MSSTGSQEDTQSGYNNSVELAHLNCEPSYADLDLQSETDSVSEEFLQWFHSSRRSRAALPANPVNPKIKIELDRMACKPDQDVGKAANELILNAGDLVKKECNAEDHDLNPIRVEWQEGNPATVTMDLENYEGPLPAENPPPTCSPLMADYRTIRARFFLATGIYTIIVGFGVTMICLAAKKGFW